jgi:hypothetical protein
MMKECLPNKSIYYCGDAALAPIQDVLAMSETFFTQPPKEADIPPGLAGDRAVKAVSDP